MKKIIGIILAVLTVLLGIFAWFHLPETVTVQFSMRGQPSNTMSKPLAILLPTVLSIAGGIIGLKEEEKTGQKGRMMAGVGLLLMIITLLMNR